MNQDTNSPELYPGQAREKARVVTVCNMCHTSSCWLGLFPCEHSRCAGSEQRTVGELDELKLEHRDWYSQKTLFKHQRP